MDVKSYCDSVGQELGGWKARLTDTIRKTESLDDQQKAKISPLLGDLKALMNALDERIDRLASECPVDYSSDREAIEGSLSKVKDGWKKVYGAMGEEEYGVGGA